MGLGPARLQAVHLGLVLVPALHALHLAELLKRRLHARAPAHVQLRPRSRARSGGLRGAQWLV